MVEVSPFYRKQYHCPVCEMVFESFAIRSSKINLARRESDFHPCYRGPSPMHYAVIVCPLCNYATAAKRFNDRLTADSLQIVSVALQLLSDKRQDFTRERTLDDVMASLDRAIDVASLKQDDEDHIANMYLYKAWVAREAGNQEVEQECLSKTLHNLLYVFNHRSSGPSVFNDVQLPYLIGEMHFRLGDYEEAVKWYMYTVGLREIKLHPQIEKMARDRWNDAREAFSQQQAPVEEAADAAAESAPDDRPAGPAARSNSNLFGKMVQSISSPSKTPRPRRGQQQLALETGILDWLHRLQDAGPEDATLEDVLNTCLQVVINQNASLDLAADSWRDRSTLLALLSGPKT